MNKTLYLCQSCQGKHSMIYNKKKIRNFCLIKNTIARKCLIEWMLFEEFKTEKKYVSIGTKLKKKQNKMEVGKVSG